MLISLSSCAVFDAASVFSLGWREETQKLEHKVPVKNTACVRKINFSPGSVLFIVGEGGGIFSPENWPGNVKVV